MLVALTGIGLSAAAGLNAYIPFLLVALLARLTDTVVLPDGLGWMSSWWAIGIGAVLLLADVVLDKIPAVDSVNDVVRACCARSRAASCSRRAPQRPSSSRRPGCASTRG